MLLTVFRSRVRPGLRDEYAAAVDRMDQSRLGNAPVCPAGKSVQDGESYGRSHLENGAARAEICRDPTANEGRPVEVPVGRLK